MWAISRPKKPTMLERKTVLGDELQQTLVEFISNVECNFYGLTKRNVRIAVNFLG